LALRFFLLAPLLNAPVFHCVQNVSEWLEDVLPFVHGTLADLSHRVRGGALGVRFALLCP